MTKRTSININGSLIYRWKLNRKHGMPDVACKMLCMYSWVRNEKHNYSMVISYKPNIFNRNLPFIKIKKNELRININ